MKSPAFFISFLAASIALWGSSARAQEAPLKLKMSGTIEVGGGAYQLTNGYPGRRVAYVRGELRPAEGQRWTGEIASVSEFGDSGTLFVLGYETEFGRRWIFQAGGATSSDGATLPRLRLDVSLGRKWLKEANLVTTIAITGIEAKDEHRDHAVQLSTAYFFDMSGMPWVVEGGVRRNISDPGAVGATSYYGAVTRGREKERLISLRLGTGHESYQLVGGTAALVGFPSNAWQFSWREWLNRSNGFKLQLDGYHNPYYNRRGLEAAWFWDF